MRYRVEIIVSVVILVVLGAYFWWAIAPQLRHNQFCDATKAGFESLAKKRPPTVTRKQWHHVVAWTLNAHANCITFTRNIPQAERDKFLTELRARISKPVELATIDWIWDEMIRLTPVGQHYSDRWRPTTPERLEEFEESNLSWVGIEID